MSTGTTWKKWLWRLFLLGFVAIVTIGLWLLPIISRTVEKDYDFPEVTVDATVLPNGDLELEETRTFDFRNGPFTYAYFNVDDPLDHVRDFTIAEDGSRWWTSDRGRRGFGHADRDRGGPGKHGLPRPRGALATVSPPPLESEKDSSGPGSGSEGHGPPGHAEANGHDED